MTPLEKLELLCKLQLRVQLSLKIQCYKNYYVISYKCTWSLKRKNHRNIYQIPVKFIRYLRKKVIWQSICFIQPTIIHKIYWDRFTKSLKSRTSMESLMADFVQFSSGIVRFSFLERRLDTAIYLHSILIFS